MLGLGLAVVGRSRVQVLSRGEGATSRGGRSAPGHGWAVGLESLPQAVLWVLRALAMQQEQLGR